MGLFDGLFSGRRGIRMDNAALAAAMDEGAAPVAAMDEGAPSSSSSQHSSIPPLSPTAASVVDRCAWIAGVPVEQLVRRFEPEQTEQPPTPPGVYARSLVEYCSYATGRVRRMENLRGILYGDGTVILYSAVSQSLLMTRNYSVVSQSQTKRDGEEK